MTSGVPPRPANTTHDADAAISVFAPAKINLSLHVCGRRDDGYHVLDSLVVFAGIGDWISARHASTFELSIGGPFADTLGTTADENLVLRAARFLAATTGRGEGARIHLEKNLPVASGIGGGSSDAAATLSACAELWGENLSPLADADLAAGLGADVPVCLRRRATFMRGIGEILDPAPELPSAWLVLVNPGLALSTKDVFAALTGRFSTPPPADALRDLKTPADLAAGLKVFRNDMSAPAIELMPDIAQILHRLEALPGCLLARMSGSGPTCFGLFATSGEAGHAADALRRARPDWWVAPAPLL